jgi:hypothetical protein
MTFFEAANTEKKIRPVSKDGDSDDAYISASDWLFGRNASFFVENPVWEVQAEITPVTRYEIQSLLATANDIRELRELLYQILKCGYDNKSKDKPK